MKQLTMETCNGKCIVLVLVDTDTREVRYVVVSTMN